MLELDEDELELEELEDDEDDEELVVLDDELVLTEEELDDEPPAQITGVMIIGVVTPVMLSASAPARLRATAPLLQA